MAQQPDISGCCAKERWNAAQSRSLVASVSAVAGSDYHVIGLVPSGERFDLDAVLDTLAASRWSAAHLTSADGRPGIRVVESDGWGISAWLDDDDDAREMNALLAERSLPPAMRFDEVAGCPAQLSIWSDDDDDLMNAHVFEEFIQLLKERFGVLLWDNRLSEWR